MPSAAEATATTMPNGTAARSTRAQRAVAFARVGILVVVVLILDQVTKHAVIANIQSDLTIVSLGAWM